MSIPHVSQQEFVLRWTFATNRDIIFLLSTLSNRKEVYQFELFYFFSYFGCGKCSWLLHMQMVRPESLDS